MRMRPKRLPRKEAFEWIMEGPPPREGCWAWQASLSPNGYGLFWFGGKYRSAHRVSYELYRGEIPEGHFVLHDPVLCNNGRCVAPHHLRVGTHQENVDDKIISGTKLQGERVTGAKLTEELVRAIRAEYAAGGITHSELAEKYGVASRRTIERVVNRQTWKHVE